jgi:hypothetical protein
MKEKIMRLIKAFKLGGLTGLITAWNNYPSDWLDENGL